MSKLVSGMMLVEKETGNLHYLIASPYGYRIIDVNGCCEEFDVNNYEKAYIPKDYSDCWEPLQETIIIF